MYLPLRALLILHLGFVLSGTHTLKGPGEAEVEIQMKGCSPWPSSCQEDALWKACRRARSIMWVPNSASLSAVSALMM